MNQSELTQTSPSTTHTTPADVTQLDTSALIDYILRRYHQVHREQFVELIELATRVEVVHVEDPQAPVGLARQLHLMQSELEDHMQKEEQILFPMLMRQSGFSPAGPIHVMREDHKAHEQEIDKLLLLTDNLKLPNDACGSWRSLYSGLRILIDDLHAHIELENEVLFPRAGY